MLSHCTTCTAGNPESPPTRSKTLYSRGRVLGRSPSPRRRPTRYPASPDRSPSSPDRSAPRGRARESRPADRFRSRSRSWKPSAARFRRRDDDFPSHRPSQQSRFDTRRPEDRYRDASRGRSRSYSPPSKAELPRSHRWRAVPSRSRTRSRSISRTPTPGFVNHAATVIVRRELMPRSEAIRGDNSMPNVVKNQQPEVKT